MNPSLTFISSSHTTRRNYITKKIKLSSSPSPLQNFANSVNELGKKKRKKNKEKEEQMKEKLRKFPQVGDSGGVGG